MKAFILPNINEKLIEKNIDLEVSDHEFAVDVLFSGINRRDLWIQKGLYPDIILPCILGSDALVEKDGKKYILNPNVNWGSNPKIPSKDYTIRGLQKSGTFASQVSVSKDILIEKPNHLTDEEAAAIPLAGLTAYRALISNCQVTSTDRVLINGIGGGVAMYAALFAIAIGAEVIVSSSSEHKIEIAKSFGAKGGVLYTEENWGKNYKKENGGFDVIIDSAGGDGFSQLIHLANLGCRIGVYGGTRGVIPNLSPQHLFFKQIHIFGSTMGNDIEFEKMVQFIKVHKIKPIIDEIFPLSQINEAFLAMKSKERFGKIVIDNRQ